MFDYDDDYESENFYKISDYTGEPRFWGKKHPLSKLNTELFDRLVPDSGSAETPHGEMVRMINRLAYDIFNNGLCNDKREEIGYLQSTARFWKKHLDNAESIELLSDLSRTYRNDSAVEMNQENCDRLDDIIQAIVRYVASVEGVVV